MKIYKYENYEEYVSEQTRANVEKLKNVWVQEHQIKKAITYKPSAKNILCHGTRNGAEQKLFKNNLPDAYVIGTEISHTATQFSDTIQHDFHDVKDEFINKFDIVYSNAFVHSFDPDGALTTWKNQLTDDGIIIIELMTGAENRSRSIDPLEISFDEFTDLADRVGLKVIDHSMIQRRNGAPSIMVVLVK